MGFRLARTVLGRLASHATLPVNSVSDPWDITQWTGGTPSIATGGQLKITSGLGAVRYTPLGTLTDQYVQVLGSYQGTVAGTMGVSARATADKTGLGGLSPVISAGSRGLYEYNGGSIVQSSVTSSVTDTFYRYSLKAVGTTAKLYMATPNLEYTLTGVAVASGYPGVWADGNVREFTEFHVCRSADITVRGPTTFNWQARVKNAGGTVLATATASAGVATVDTFAARLAANGIYTVEIYNTDTSTIVATNTPLQRVWPGDAWFFYDDTVSPKGSVARTTLGRVAAYGASTIANVRDAFVVGDWTKSADITLSLSSGNLRLTPSSSGIYGRIAYPTALADRSNGFYFARYSGGSGSTYPAILARWGDINNLLTAQVRVLTSPANHSLYERSGGIITRITEVAVGNVSAPQRIAFDLNGTTGRSKSLDAYGYTRTITNFTRTTSAKTGLAHNADATQYAEYSDFSVMSGPTITVNGPSASAWTVNLRDGSGNVVACRDATAGVATIDALTVGLSFPDVYAVDVIDGNGTQLAYLAPTERVWAGDVYTFVAPSGGGMLTLRRRNQVD